MSKDGIRERINDFREVFKILLLLDVTLMSGIVIDFYNVLIKKVPFYMAIFGGVGVIVLIQLLIFTMTILRS